jgi:YVTN family beta-propeller protein
MNLEQDRPQMNLKTVAACIVLVSAIMPALPSAAAEPTPAYKIAKTIPLGPGERWDYATFDPSSGRVYVAHGDHVTVVDSTSGKVVGSVGPLPGGTHGIAISTGNGIGYTDDGKAGIAAAFDLKTLKITRQIPTAPDADGIVRDPVTGHIFVINGDSGSITVIDPKTNAVIATIKIGAGLEAGVMDGNGKFFVDGAEQHDIIAIDTKTNTVVAHYPMPGCERPHGIAVDAVTRRVFATCVNKVMTIVDADKGTVVATLPIGQGSDGAAFDPKRKLAISSNGDGTLSVIQEKDADHFVALPDVPTVRSARTIAIDASTGRLFLPAADITKIDPPTEKGGRPHVTFAPGSAKLLVLEPAE